MSVTIWGQCFICSYILECLSVLILVLLFFQVFHFKGWSGQNRGSPPRFSAQKPCKVMKILDDVKVKTSLILALFLVYIINFITLTSIWRFSHLSLYFNDITLVMHIVCFNFNSMVLLVSPDEDIPLELQSVSEQLSRTQLSSRDVAILLILHCFQAALGPDNNRQGLHIALQVTSHSLNSINTKFLFILPFYNPWLCFTLPPGKATGRAGEANGGIEWHHGDSSLYNRCQHSKTRCTAEHGKTQRKHHCPSASWWSPTDWLNRRYKYINIQNAVDRLLFSKLKQWSFPKLRIASSH